jgi:SRSO17 transposase
MEGLAQAAGHADRAVPLNSYCLGLLLPGERKSVEPMPHGWLRTMFSACISHCTT